MTQTNQIQKKMLDTNGLVKKQIIMLKLLKQRVKFLVFLVQLIPNTVALTAAENKIPGVSNLIKKDIL